MPESASASAVIEVSGTLTAASCPASRPRAGCRVADLGQVARGELVGVGDQQSAAGEVGQVGLQRGRVHHDQDVGGVARGHDVVVGEVQLEGADAGQGARWRPDLGREVGQRRQVVAERRGLAGEPTAGQLHAVAGVTGQPDDDAVELDDALDQAAGSSCGLPGPTSPAAGLIPELVPVICEVPPNGQVTCGLPGPTCRSRGNVRQPTTGVAEQPAGPPGRGGERRRRRTAFYPACNGGTTG